MQRSRHGERGARREHRGRNGRPPGPGIPRALDRPAPCIPTSSAGLALRSRLRVRPRPHRLPDRSDGGAGDRRGPRVPPRTRARGVRRWVDPVPQKRRYACTFPLCPDRAETRGLCEKHGSQRKVPCSTPGCGGFNCCQSGCRGACERCFKLARRTRDRKRGNAAARGYGAAWRKRRKKFIEENPTCPCGQPATDVDHVIARRVGGADDVSNYQALCHRCHSRKTARVDRRTG